MTGEITAVLFGSFLLLLLIGAPIYLALGGSSVLTITVFQLDPLTVLPSSVQGSTASFTLLAIPLFILAGNLLAGSELTERLIALARAIVGNLPGGLAVVSVVVGIFFAGISGSGAADTAALGAILIPSMVKDGYDRGFSAALVAADGAIGIIIPPSIGLIIYGVVANASIGRLFIAGVVPGLVVGACLAIVSVLTARVKGWGRPQRAESDRPIDTERTVQPYVGPSAAAGSAPARPARPARPSRLHAVTARLRGRSGSQAMPPHLPAPVEEERRPVAVQPAGSPHRGRYRVIEIGVALRRAIWGLAAPLIILGGIYGGIFTPTESAGVVVVYALFVGLVVYRDLTPSRLVKTLATSARITGVVMFILATATLFALLLNTQGIATQITSALANSGLGKITTLLIIDALLIIAGAFLDIIGTYYILLPILLPVVTALGVDPVHFGIITTVALAISLVPMPRSLS